LLLGCLLFYAAVMWIWGAGRLEIAHSMEAARAVGARTMMRTGDYLIPRMGRSYNLAKPPLFYWTVAAASRAGGKVTASTTRLPSAICAMGVLLALYVSAGPVLGRGTALIACAVAATVPMAFGAATVGQVNMMLALAVAISIFAAFYMLESPRHARAYAALCGVGLAMGLMTKGPILLMFFVPTVMLYMGFRQGGRLAEDWRWSVPYMAAMAFLVWLSLAATSLLGTAGAVPYLLPFGMLAYFSLRGERATGSHRGWLIVLGVAVLLSAVWPVLAARRLGFERLQEALVREVWQSRSAQVGISNRAPIWYYLVALPAAAFPYSLAAPLAFLRHYRSEASASQKRILMLARCWLIGSIVLFSVASPARRLRYLLPVFPAISLLAADVMVRAAAQELRPWMNRYIRLGGALVVYALCVAPLALPCVWFAVGLGFSGWLITMTMLAILGAATGLYLHRVRHNPGAALIALAIVLVGIKVFLHFGYSEILNARESARLACQRIRSQVPSGEQLYLFGYGRPQVVFYLDPEPLVLKEAQKWRGHAFVCSEAGRTDLSPLLAAFRHAELDRVKWARGELVLLRIEKPP